jgi:hypothetical protein
MSSHTAPQDENDQAVEFVTVNSLEENYSTRGGTEYRIADMVDAVVWRRAIPQRCLRIMNDLKR